MASISDDPNGRRRIQFVAPDGSRKTVRFGKIDRRGAESVCRYVEALLSAKIGGQPVPEDTAAWLSGIDRASGGKHSGERVALKRAQQTDAESVRESHTDAGNPCSHQVMRFRAIRDVILHKRLAERKGFEPLVQFYPYAALAKPCFRPLSHLSDGCHLSIALAG